MPEKEAQQEHQELSETMQRGHYSKSARPFALYSSLPYYSILVMYVMMFACVKHGMSWLMAVFYFAIIPLLDFALPTDWLNPNKTQEKDLESSIFFKLPLYAAIICDWALLFYSVQQLNQMQELDLIYASGVIFTVTVSAASNFTTAHELYHKQDFLGRFVGCAAMSKSFYMHFFIEHLYGHHRNVATPKDPATSKFNQSFYAYLPQTLIGNWKSAWRYEKRRLIEVESCSSLWSLRNRMLWFLLSSLMFPVVMYYYSGVIGLVTLCVSGVLSVVYVESINYIEHYGLERKSIGTDMWEKVDIRHSWNAPHRLTNYLLFKLQRHSDHHENSYKPYQILSSYDASPQLPNGYALCTMLAFYPKYWFEVMNPIVQAYKRNTKVDEATRKNGQRLMLNYVCSLTLLFGGFAVAELTLSYPIKISIF